MEDRGGVGVMHNLSISITKGKEIEEKNMRVSFDLYQIGMHRNDFLRIVSDSNVAETVWPEKLGDSRYFFINDLGDWEFMCDCPDLPDGVVMLNLSRRSAEVGREIFFTACVSILDFDVLAKNEGWPSLKSVGFKAEGD